MIQHGESPLLPPRVATFTTTELFINLGVCNATYKAPSATTLPVSVVDQVTASYQGAYAYISIEVYKQ